MNVLAELEALRARIADLEAQLARPLHALTRDDADVEGAEVLRTLVDNVREVFFVRDRATGKMLFASPVFEEIWGISREVLYDDPRAFTAAVLPEDRAQVVERLRLQDEGVPFCGEYRIRDAKGEVRWIFARTFFVQREGLDRLVGIAEDITARKKAETEVLRLKEDLERLVTERTAQLRASLTDKEILLREVHHRVKNNLQLVSSLLYLQSRNLADAAAQRALADSRDRIAAIAMVHDHLYRSTGLERVELDQYVGTLVMSLADTMSALSRKVQITRKIDGVQLPIDRAIPCGLIVNELLTNAVKHAFIDGRHGHILVEGTRAPDGRITVRVADDGIGLSRDPSTSPTLGLQLVRTLVEQLDGELEVDVTEGTSFRIRFEEMGRANGDAHPRSA